MARAQSLTLGEKAKLDGIITAERAGSMTMKLERRQRRRRLNANTDVARHQGPARPPQGRRGRDRAHPRAEGGREGVGDDKGALIATKVRFAGEDLKTAQAIQAGMAETEAQGRRERGGRSRRTNKRRHRGEQIARPHRQARRVRRPRRRSRCISRSAARFSRQEGARRAREARRPAKELKGYLVGVEGYADASGGATSTRSSASTAARPW